MRSESSIFATTALVAFAGAAAADVTLSGTAEMGIAGGDGFGINTTFFQSFDVRFTASGQTDNGLSFGAIVDLEDVIDSVGAGSDLVDDAGNFADYTVFISGDFGTLTMGDTDGALDWALNDMGNVGNPGSLGDNETGHAGYNGNGLFDGIYQGQVLRYNYAIGDFGFAVSAQVDNNVARDGDTQIQLGFRYGLDLGAADVDFGLGYATVSDALAAAGDQGYDVVALSISTELDAGFSAVVNYTNINDSGFYGGDGEHIGVGLGYTVDALAFHVNYGEYDWDTTAAAADADGWGFAASYDLGGGLTAHAGYGYSDVTAVNGSATAILRDTSTFSLGLRMAF